MRKVLIFLSTIVLLSCKKNVDNYPQNTSDEYAETNDEVDNSDFSTEQDGEVHNEIINFTCDDPQLIASVEAKVGQISNIMTVGKNDELKTCECEAYSKNLKFPFRDYYTNGTEYVNYHYGGTLVYKAQLKDNGEIVWNGTSRR